MKVIWLPGLSGYAETLSLQEKMVEAHQGDPGLEDELLLLEHEPVYTIGRTRDHSSLSTGLPLPYPVVEINRGGQATYHGPGQLVGYPIVDLNRAGRDLHLYIRRLEQTLIAACEKFGVKARMREGLVGIWVEDRKLASIGVGVKKWITMHGFAVNIDRRSLSPFAQITPCGLQGVKMTCLEDEMKRAGRFMEENLLKEFGEIFASIWIGYSSKQSTKEEGNNNESV